MYSCKSENLVSFPAYALGMSSDFESVSEIYSTSGSSFKTAINVAVKLTS